MIHIFTTPDFPGEVRGRLFLSTITNPMARLQGTVAVVTGASRGAGRGVALVLGEEGATVYVTGRSIRGSTTQDRPETIEDTAEAVTAQGGTGIAVRCDHTVDADIEALFARVQDEHGRIDLLVNNAWGGYEIMVGFDKFWEIPMEHWRLMFRAGLRAQMVTTRLALPLMLPQQHGLIINTTSPVATNYHGNVFYDVAKTAVNRMSFAMSHDLREEGITVIALAPGWMRTEKVLDHFKVDADQWHTIPDAENTHSTIYTGRAVAALAADPDVMQRTGQILEVGDVARAYGFTDTDGRQVPPFRELYPELFGT